MKLQDSLSIQSEDEGTVSKIAVDKEVSRQKQT